MSDVVRDGRAVRHGLRVGPGLVNAWRWVCRAFFARIGWVAAGLLLILLGFDAKAHTCVAPNTEHYYTADCPYISGGATLEVAGIAQHLAACGAAHVASLNATISDPAYKWTYAGTTGISISYPYDSGYYIRSRGGPSPVTQQTQEVVEHKCRAPTVPQCALPSGTKRRITSDVGTIDGSFCFSNCSVTTDYGAPVIDISDSITRFGIVSSGNACTNNNPDVEPTNTEGEVTDGTDTLSEFDQTGQQCGYVNGEYVCLATIPAGDCTLTPGKTAVCSPGATPPKAPDNGTPGQAATPNATITNNGGQGNTYNVYNSSTVNNSTNLGEGDPDGDGSDSSGECDPGDTACEGGGRGDGRVGGPGGTAKTYGASTAGLYAAVQASPIGSAVNGIATGFPTGGTCPVLAMNLPIIGAISTDIHCDLWSGTVGPLLSLVFLAIWALAAVRIVLEG